MHPASPLPLVPAYTVTPVFLQKSGLLFHHYHPSLDMGLALICYSVNIDPLNDYRFYTIGTVFIMFCNLILAL